MTRERTTTTTKENNTMGNTPALRTHKLVTVINPDDYESRFWARNYRLTVSRFGIEYLVNADCAQSAIDELIDWAEVNAPGYLFTRAEEEREEFIDEYMSGGNHGRTLNTLNIRIEIENEAAI
jgi:hypothetical protein